MPRYEISWKVFGVLVVEAEDEEDARDVLDDELFGGPDYDGLDYSIEEIED